MWKKLINFFKPKPRLVFELDEVFTIIEIIDKKIGDEYNWKDFDKKWTVDFVIDPSLCVNEEDLKKTMTINNIKIVKK